MWEGHAGQTQANPFGFGIHLESITCLHVTVLSGISGICRADCYMHADCYMLYACNSARLLARPLTSFSRTPPTINPLPLLAANAADCSSHARRYFESAQHGVTSASCFILRVVSGCHYVADVKSGSAGVSMQPAISTRFTACCDASVQGAAPTCYESLGLGWIAAWLLWMFNSRFGGDRMLR